MSLRKVREYLPSIGLAALFLGLALYIVSYKGETFAPLSLAPVTVQVNGKVTPGQKIALTNGVCVKGERPVAVTVQLGFSQVGIDPLVVKPVEIVNQELALLPTCQYTNPISLTVPELPSGTWYVYTILTARGKDITQMQRVSSVSNSFEVVSAQSQ